MNIDTAIETGLAIIPLLDDEDFFVNKDQRDSFIIAKNTILNHSDENDDEEKTKDSFIALNALKRAINMAQTSSR